MFYPLRILPLITYFTVLHYMFGALYVPSRFLGNEKVPDSILLTLRSGSCAIEVQTESVLAQNKKLKFPVLFQFFIYCWKSISHDPAHDILRQWDNSWTKLSWPVVQCHDWVGFFLFNQNILLSSSPLKP